MSVVFQGIPPSNVPFLNPDGTVSIVWYRFLQSITSKSGLSPTVPAGQFNRIGVLESANRKAGVTLIHGGPNASCAIGDDAGPILMIYNVQTGEAFGWIQIPNVF
jgi:hypothetical protein